MSIVKIALPRYPSNGKEIPLFFKQLELCIHHARKAYEVQVQNRNGVEEDDYVNYGIPSLESSIKEANDNFIKEYESTSVNLNKEVIEHLNFVSNLSDNFHEKKEDVELEIYVS